MATSTELTPLQFVDCGLYNTKNFPVMLPWEKAYMEHCINMLPPPQSTQELFKKLTLEYEISEFMIEKPENLPYAKKHKNIMFVPQLTYYG